jgi:hypothetical protein
MPDIANDQSFVTIASPLSDLASIAVLCFERERRRVMRKSSGKSSRRRLAFASDGGVRPAAIFPAKFVPRYRKDVIASDRMRIDFINDVYYLWDRAIEALE